MKSFDPFTLIVMGILLTLGLAAIGIAVWINRPLPRRRKFRDQPERNRSQDEHGSWKFI
jgi:hypothetical protein